MSYGVYGRGQQVTLARRSPKDGPAKYDDYGNVQYQVSTKILRGCAVWPVSNTEADTAGQFERTTSFYSLTVPLAEPVGSVDYVLWNGLRFEVSGEPARYVSPHTGNGYQLVNLRRVEG